MVWVSMEMDSEIPFVKLLMVTVLAVLVLLIIFYTIKLLRIVCRSLSSQNVRNTEIEMTDVQSN